MVARQLPRDPARGRARPTPLFPRLVVSCPNAGGGLAIFDAGSLDFVPGLKATGICSARGRLLIGLQSGRIAVLSDMGSRLLPGHFDDVHDVAVIADSVHAVVTTDNAVLRLDPAGNPDGRWQFTAARDAWHLNCLLEWHGGVAFTAFGIFEDAQGYRGRTRGGGILAELTTGRTLIAGLSQPHSPTATETGLLIANSEFNEIRAYDRTLRLLRHRDLGGYTRGILVQGGITYVGISRHRAMGEAGPPNARLVALDTTTWEEIGRLELPSEEIYSIAELPDGMTADRLGSQLRALSHELSGG